MSKIKYPKHEKAITYALEQIKQSELLPYIQDVILFGSVARGEEREDSDIDLLLVLSEDIKQVEGYRKKCRLLKSLISSDELYDAETDLKICIGNEWETSFATIYQCIQRDGVNIWKV
jgi:predicted nucleotidyltransferase